MLRAQEAMLHARSAQREPYCICTQQPRLALVSQAST